MQYSYKEGPHGRPNRCIKAATTKGQNQDPPDRLLREDGAEGAHPAVGRPPWSLNFGGKVTTAILTSVTNVSLYNSPGNCPWKSIKGGGALIFNTNHIGAP